MDPSEKARRPRAIAAAPVQAQKRDSLGSVLMLSCTRAYAHPNLTPCPRQSRAAAQLRRGAALPVLHKGVSRSLPAANKRVAHGLSAYPKTEPLLSAHFNQIKH